MKIDLKHLKPHFLIEIYNNLKLLKFVKGSNWLNCLKIGDAGQSGEF